MGLMFNGTGVSLGNTAIAGIRAVHYRGAAPRVPQTASDAAIRIFKCGIPRESLTVEAIGGNATAKGTTPAVVTAWADGGSDGSFTKGRIMKAPGMAGRTDQPNVTTITIKPSK